MKNKFAVIGSIVLLIVVLCAGAGFYVYSMYNPKGCVSVVSKNYPPAFEIMDGTAYDVNGPEIAKINAVKDSCLAVVKGQDSSVDKCNALSNLSEAMELIYTNAENGGVSSVVASTASDLKSLQKSLDKSFATSCKAEYDVLNKAVEVVNKAEKSKKSAK